jgi:hypothetical protein
MNLGGSDARARLVRATFNGAPLALVPAFNYLGITFKEGEPLGASAPAARLRPAGKVLGAMRGSCARAGALPPSMQAEVWDALVRSVLLHGVELWGAYPTASGALGDGRRRVESSHTSFLRGLLATRAATPELVVMPETGRFPLALSIKAGPVQHLQPTERGNGPSGASWRAGLRSGIGRRRDKRRPGLEPVCAAREARAQGGRGRGAADAPAAEYIVFYVQFKRQSTD